MTAASYAAQEKMAKAIATIAQQQEPGRSEHEIALPYCLDPSLNLPVVA